MTPPARTLTPEELAALHAVQLEILRAFDRVCRQLGLQYHLAAGTLLGAIRHGGFIPWDDDVDVVMPRRDYQRLLAEAPALLGPDLFLQTLHSDPGYEALFAKLRRNGSVFRALRRRDRPHHEGIFIDIFPFDNVDLETRMGRLHYESVLALRRLFRLAHRPRRTPPPVPVPAWRRMGERALRSLLALVPPKAYLRAVERVMRLTEGRDTREVANLCSLPSARPERARLVRPRAEIEDTIAVTFEGHSFPAPAAYVVTLTRLYGDYGKLPPKRRRRPSHPLTAFSLPP